MSLEKVNVDGRYQLIIYNDKEESVFGSKYIIIIMLENITSILTLQAELLHVS